MSRRVIISGGGTGGHIFPAVAIANALKREDPSIEILFVGALGRMEMEKVPAEGYQIVGLPVQGFQRSLSLKNLSFFTNLWKSMRAARAIVRDFKPDVAVGVGGFASGPLLRAASVMGIPTLIQEQNSYAGVTNRLLARGAKKICVAYKGMERYFPASKIILTGNPVRQDIENVIGRREEAFKYFGLDDTKKVVLVVGGSLGARTLNEAMAAAADDLAEAGIQVIWQTGKYYYSQVKDLDIKHIGKGVKVLDFVNRMDLAYAAANLVVSRAGAGSISELCLVAKPAILVPSPNVAEDHQTKNAMALVSENAAVMVPDALAGKQLKSKILDILSNEELAMSLSRNITALALPGAATIIAREVLKLIDNK